MCVIPIIASSYFVFFYFNCFMDSAEAKKSLLNRNLSFQIFQKRFKVIHGRVCVLVAPNDWCHFL